VLSTDVWAPNCISHAPAPVPAPVTHSWVLTSTGTNRCTTSTTSILFPASFCTTLGGAQSYLCGTTPSCVTTAACPTVGATCCVPQDMGGLVFQAANYSCQ
jgi:hypothetical protein